MAKMRSLSVRIGPEELEKMREEAERDGVGYTAWIVDCARRELERRQSAKATPAPSGA